VLDEEGTGSAELLLLAEEEEDESFVSELELLLASEEYEKNDDEESSVSELELLLSSEDDDDISARLELLILFCKSFLVGNSTVERSAQAKKSAAARLRSKRWVAGKVGILVFAI